MVVGCWGARVLGWQGGRVDGGAPLAQSVPASKNQFCWPPINKMNFFVCFKQFTANVAIFHSILLIGGGQMGKGPYRPQHIDGMVSTTNTVHESMISETWFRVQGLGFRVQG